MSSPYPESRNVCCLIFTPEAHSTGQFVLVNCNNCSHFLVVSALRMKEQQGGCVIGSEYHSQHLQPIRYAESDSTNLITHMIIDGRQPHTRLQSK